MYRGGGGGGGSEREMTGVELSGRSTFHVVYIQEWPITF